MQYPDLALPVIKKFLVSGDLDYHLLWLKGFMITQAVELPLAWWVLARHLRRKGRPVSTGRIIAGVVIGNMATHPFLWFVFPEFMGYGLTLFFGELTAVLVEALLYRLIVGGSMTVSLGASLAANLGSVLAGLLIMPPF